MVKQTAAMPAVSGPILDGANGDDTLRSLFARQMDRQSMFSAMQDNLRNFCPARYQGTPEGTVSAKPNGTYCGECQNSETSTVLTQIVYPC